MAEVKDIKRDVKINPSGITPAEHVREIWSATAAYGTTREDIENPAYWAHVAIRLRPKARVEIHAEDDTFFAEYLVVASDKTWAKVVNLRWINLIEAVKLTAEQTSTIADGYEIKFRGPKKFSVIRKSDRSTLQEGMHTEEDAKKWLSVYLNSQGIAA